MSRHAYVGPPRWFGRVLVGVLLGLTVVWVAGLVLAGVAFTLFAGGL